MAIIDIGTEPDNKLTFAQACAVLELSTTQVVALREQGLVVCVREHGYQRYPRIPLELTRQLLQLGRSYGWTPPTLAWYADLLFVAHVGRTVLRSASEAPPVAASPSPPASWLETPLTSSLVDELAALHSHPPTIAGMVRTIVAATALAGQHWADLDAFRTSALAPIVERLEAEGIPVIQPARGLAEWEAGQGFIVFLHTFAMTAPPVSLELRRIIDEARQRLRQVTFHPAAVPANEQALIEAEDLVAVDRLYATHAAEIHSAPLAVNTEGNLVIIPKRTVSLQMSLVGLEPAKPIIDNIVDAVRPYMGAFGARVVLALYEIANDAPYWRQPIIEIETNELLDRLGMQRDKRQIHYTDSRRRLRDTLMAAHNLEIIGERTVAENGVPVRKAFQETLLSVIGGDFDPDETRGITTADLFKKGLPKKLRIRLNFYDGIRRGDGTLANNYVLMPRLAPAPTLVNAKYGATADRLKTYLLIRYRAGRPPRPAVPLTRAEALEHSGIADSNTSRAVKTLTRALTRLAEEGVIESHDPIPSADHETFIVTLSAKTCGILIEPAGQL